MSGDVTQDARSTQRRDRRKPSLRLVFSADAGIVENAPTWLKPGQYTAGRQPGDGAGIVIDDDPLLSRRHAMFRVGPGGSKVQLVDLDSRNGSAVNGRPVKEQWLVDGDVVRLGDSFLVLRWADPDQADADVPGLTGTAPGIRELRRAVAQIGPSDATALLIGASGTGKEVTARALHALSGRTGPFVAINCTAIPESLAESQLFGHKAGAFTGAQGAHPGFFRAANGGTLFLDEVGDLSPTLQPKLLRALEERMVMPVGEVKPVAFDARLIAATNQNLDQMVADNTFRGDLYARLAQLKIALPRLNRRREDILLLLKTHLEPDTPPLAPDLVEALLIYPWPHNVRELISVATELKVRGAGLDELVPELVVGRLSGAPPPSMTPADPTSLSVPKPLPSKADLEGLLSLHQGNLAHVAREVGRSRMQVYRWLNKYELDAADFRED